MLFRTLITLCIILALPLAKADLNEVESHFLAGIKAYQNNEPEKASENFLKALQIEPNNSQVLYNFGLASYKNNQLGLAIGAWRKALRLSPHLDDAHRALELAIAKLKSPLPTPSPGSIESFHKNFFKIPSYALHIFCLLFLFLSIWRWVNFISQRKEALSNDLPLPKTPYLTLLLSLFALCFTVMTASKVYDGQLNRATIVNEQISLRTGPSTEDAELFEVFEGSEVIVLRRNNNWSQVRLPGSIVGWLPDQSLFF